MVVSTVKALKCPQRRIPPSAFALVPFAALSVPLPASEPQRARRKKFRKDAIGARHQDFYQAYSPPTISWSVNCVSHDAFTVWPPADGELFSDVELGMSYCEGSSILYSQ